MARDEHGAFLRSVSQTAPGNKVSIMLADGRILGTVDAVEPAPSSPDLPEGDA